MGLVHGRGACDGMQKVRVTHPTASSCSSHSSHEVVHVHCSTSDPGRSSSAPRPRAGAAAPAAPGLQVLGLSRCFQLTAAALSGALAAAAAPGAPLAACALSHLALSGWPAGDGAAPPAPPAARAEPVGPPAPGAAAGLGRLRILALTNCSRLGAPGLAALAAGAPGLRALLLGGSGLAPPRTAAAAAAAAAALPGHAAAAALMAGPAPPGAITAAATERVERAYAAHAAARDQRFPPSYLPMGWQDSIPEAVRAEEFAAREAAAYAVPEGGLQPGEAAAAALLAAAAGALPALALLELSFFAPPVVAAVAAALGARRPVRQPCGRGSWRHRHLFFCRACHAWCPLTACSLAARLHAGSSARLLRGGQASA